MKQGKFFRNLIMWVLLAAIAVYFAFSLANSLFEPLLTTSAVEYEAGSGYYATGYVVREETVITSAYGTTSLTASEGEHVSAGGQVATAYLTEEARSRQALITELTGRLEQLRFACQYSSSALDQAALDSQIGDALLDLSGYLARRDMNSVQALSPELKGLVLRRDSPDADEDSLKAEIGVTEAEISRLQSQADSDTRPVTVSSAGCFSAAADGFESVLTPESLMSMSVQQYSALAPEQPEENAIGRLITSDTWYFVAAVPASQLGDVRAGDTVTLSFARDFYTDVEMTVERIGDNEAGFRLLVLSSDRFLQNISLLRRQSADIVFEQYPGLRVPKDAVRVSDNGTPGVFVVESSVARWKNIRILYDNGESYVVELDKSSTSNLWPGDELIITAGDLYDGKVVK